MSLIAVTGASGFLGRHLIASLKDAGHSVRAITRDAAVDPALSSLVDETRGGLAVGDQGALSRALEGVEAVCHLAGRAHVLRETESDPAAAFRVANADLTQSLALAADAVGVRRLVFVSTIGVHGTGCADGEVWTELSPLRPATPYAQSKLLAEERLREVSAAGHLQYVILRPPLIHGAQAKGNFSRLQGLVRRGLPLPLGSVRNRRSFIGARNLVDLIVHCLDTPAVANHTYLVSDAEPLSTPELIRTLAAGMGRRAWLLPFPVSALQALAKLAGQQRQLEQLIGDLEVDASSIRRALSWTQPWTTAQSLAEMASDRK